MGTMALPRRPGLSSTKDHLFQYKLFMISQNQIEGDPWPYARSFARSLEMERNFYVQCTHLIFLISLIFCHYWVGGVVNWKCVGQVELPTGRVEARPNPDRPHTVTQAVSNFLSTAFCFNVIFLQIFTKWRCFTGISLMCVPLKEICVLPKDGLSQL